MLTRTSTARLRVLAALIGLIAMTLVHAQVTCAGKIFVDEFELPKPASIRINEIASDSPTGDWIELYNSGDADIDIGSWSLSDNNSSNAVVFPAGTVVPARCFFVFHPASFGLGSADSAVLREPSFLSVDSYSWTFHPAASYSRCPDGSGPFINDGTATEGFANSCP
jgi:hypothetical protein